MKKLLSYLILLTLLLTAIFSATACGDKPQEEDDNTPKYTITFMVNNEVEYTAEYRETDKPFALVPLQKTGYVFDGWYDVNGETITEVDTSLKTDLTFYGELTPISYTIVFDKNGGSGTMQSITLNYDETVNLPQNAFTLENNTFGGWATSKNGQAVYTDKTEVKNLCAENGETITLYAVWKNSGDIDLPRT